ncbi:MAG: four helix bundle protein [Bacteroidota bacterium]
MADQSKIEFIELMKSRTKNISLVALKIFRKIRKTEEGKIVARQFLRSALSVGANYRAACRGRSRAEFFAKLSIAVEEADEVQFWIEIMQESQIIDFEIEDFKKELNQVLAILSKARKNTK